METATSSPVTPVADGVRLRLRVQPRARRNRVDGLAADAGGGNVLRIAVTAAPKSGAANDAVIALLAKELHLAKSALSLVSGAAGRRKVIKVSGDPQRLARQLTDWIEELENRV